MYFLQRLDYQGVAIIQKKSDFDDSVE